MTSTKRFFLYWFPVVAAMAFIYWMSTDAFSAKNTYHFIDPIIRFFAPDLSRKDIYLVHSVIRKAAHVTEYFFLGVLLFRAFRAGSNERQWGKWGGASLAVVLVYAAGDEIHQSFILSRTSSPIDVGFDVLGGVLAQVVSILWHGRQRDETSERH